MKDSQTETEKVFYMKCSRKEFEKLQQLFESGELDELLDTEIIDFGLTSTTKDRTILSQWLENIIDFDWKITNTSNLDFAVRAQQNDSSISCKKNYNLETYTMGTHSVELIVKIQPTQNQEEIDVDVRLRPCGNQSFLAAGIKFILLNDSEVIHEVESNNRDNTIRHIFTGELGDNFSIKIALGDFVMVEDFTI